MSYLCLLCLSFLLGVCRRAHVLFMFVVFVFTLGVCRRAHVLFVLVVFVFTSRCL